MKRVALLLALILALTPILVACDKDVEKTPVSSGVNEEKEYEYSLDDTPDLDFGKKKFGIFGVRGSMPFMIAEAQQIRSLDPVTLAFAACLGNVKEETFRCYSSMR